MLNFTLSSSFFFFHIKRCGTTKTCRHTNTRVLWYLIRQKPLGLISRSLAGSTHDPLQFAKSALLFSHSISKTVSFLEKQCVMSVEVNWVKHRSAARWSGAHREEKHCPAKLTFQLQVTAKKGQLRKNSWSSFHPTAWLLWCWPHSLISLSWK